MGDDTTQFQMQVAATNRKIATKENKNMTDFLRLTQELNAYSNKEVKEKFSRVEKKILGGEKDDNPASHDDLVEDNDKSVTPIGIYSNGDEIN